MAGPKFVRYFGPVLDALDALGGSGRPTEVYDSIAAALAIPEEEQAELLQSGIPRYQNQIAWARFYLAKAGYIDASQHGVWSLTDKGRGELAMPHQRALAVYKEVHEKYLARSGEADTPVDAGNEQEDEAAEAVPDAKPSDYRVALVERLRAMPPDAFERFCQRLLRESGFETVTVTGRSGDGGIDGIGVLQINALVSFKVLFQCKRYTGSVATSQVRDFRGAMVGRADKGIILTTGSFTADARREGIRDGAPPIELVDGEKLVEMCERLELGLRPRRTYELDDAFFAEFAQPAA